MMQIRMQESSTAQELDCQTWDLGITGISLDDRGAAATGFVSSKCSQVSVATYDPNAFTISIDGSERNAERTPELLAAQVGKTILLETTTLGFVELFLCTKALKELNFSSVSLLYVEPGQYSTAGGERLLHRRDFELSAEVQGFIGIPGATLVMTTRTAQRVAFFLGFEERRLDVALQTQMIKSSDAIVIFGVPAFTPGWEMHSFANNIRVIRDNALSGGVQFCGAENPAAAYDILEEIYESLLPGERLIIGPIGTKPNGTGAALFAATHPDAGLLYDHPRKSSKRTTQVARWHLFEVKF
jgi:hypothetical protein